LIGWSSGDFVRRFAAARLLLFRLPAISPIPSSIAILFILALLVLEGSAGTQEPLKNLLPLTVWTLWWAGFTFIIALAGDLWLFLKPWTGLWRLLRPSRKPLLRYPDRLEHWPAVLLYFAFTW